MTKPIVLFENFSFQYRAQTSPSLIDINLAVYPEEKVLIIGHSGSGKSTLANCINGLIPFNNPGKLSGKCFVGGLEVSKQSIFGLSKIVGTVLQDTDGQFVGLTAGEDIAFSLENNCVPKEEMLSRVHVAAEMTGIADNLDASPFNLSGGQKQRVSMSGVIAEKVHVLLFDEPLANLDPATGKQAIALIHDIKRETGATVIIIEHRLEDTLYRNADRIIVMEEGRIIADMNPDELFCTDLLRKTGLREPLYVSALKYAGVSVTQEHRSAHLDTLALAKSDKDKVSVWFAEAEEKPESSFKDSAAEVLRVQGLTFSYNTNNIKTALSDITFSLFKSEMVAIVGTNGAGKSTLAKLICGFESPDDGRIILNGRDITKESIAKRAEQIGYVMQNPNQMICKPMIFDDVALGLRNRGVSETEIRERVEHTLSVCGLHPFRKWPVSALSYGQKKRVTIASVLVMNPSLIILDEPTAGQDYRHYTEIMEFLKSLQDRSVTVLLITHDMHLMLEYAPRALVFSGGKLLADISSAELLCDPALSAKASLKETSLFHLASYCDIKDPAAFTRRFIFYEGEGKKLWQTDQD